MALINCKECGAEVIDKALDCLKCGARLRKPQRTIFGKLFKNSFIRFSVLILKRMIFGVGGVASNINTNAIDDEFAVAPIGPLIGAMFVLFIWVAGDMF